MPSRSRFCLAVCAFLLAACAAPKPTTVNYIERGQVELVQDSVVGRSSGGVITGELALPTGERRQIAVSMSECKDGIGALAILNEADTREHGMIMTFANGDRPADVLFVQMCALGMRKPGAAAK